MRSARHNSIGTDRDFATERLEIEQQVLHHLVPLIGILTEGLVDDALELVRDARLESGERRRLVLEH
jgi:hypothetical protein